MATVLLDDVIKQETVASADIINKYVLVKTGVNDAYTAANGGYFAFHIVQEGVDPNFEYVVYAQKKGADGQSLENEDHGVVVLTLNAKQEVAYMVEHGAGENFYDVVQYVHNTVEPTIGVERTVLMALKDYLNSHFSFANYQSFISDDAPAILN